MAGTSIGIDNTAHGIDCQEHQGRDQICVIGTVREQIGHQATRVGAAHDDYQQLCAEKDKEHRDESPSRHAHGSR